MEVECKGLICVYVRSVFVRVFTLIKCVLVAIYFSFSCVQEIFTVWAMRYSLVSRMKNL